MKIDRFIWMATLALLLAAPAWGQGALFVRGGNVGIGIATPTVPLEIQGQDSRINVVNTDATTTGRTLLKLSNNGFPRFVLEDTSVDSTWLMASAAGGSFVFSKLGSGVNEFVVEEGGDLTIAAEMTATAYNTSSSRELKDEIVPVNGREVLSRLVALPVAEWSFRTDQGTRHLGPMAEDFKATFGLGSHDRHIGLMDATGVTMAAIQGLNSLVEEKDAQISELERKNSELAARNEEIEERLKALEDTVARALNLGASTQ